MAKREPRESIKKLSAELGERKAAKWTPERIDALADEMLAWWKADESRCIWAAFWAERDDLTWYPELPMYLSNRSDRFLHIHTRCRLIQEARLVQRGMMPKVNPTFMEFLLINVAHYQPRSGVNIKNDNRKVELPSVQLHVGQPPRKSIDAPATDAVIMPPNPTELDRNWTDGSQEPASP